jgi:hypothetical protein
MTATHFTKKQLRFTFDLAGDKTFDNTGANRLTVSGLRASASIYQGGSLDLGDADISIYGMTLSQMNRLSTLGFRVIFVRRNAVTIEAGDENSMSVIYAGIITDAYADFSSMPNSAFRVVAKPGLDLQVQPISPTTIKGSGDVATILSGLAQQARPPLHFSNEGVDQQLSNPYFPGTVMDQIRQVAEHAGINYTIDSATRRLVIWPKGKSRGDLVPLVSKDTGMVGIPSFSSLGVSVISVFNPSLLYGQRFKIESIIPAANKEWNIVRVSHSLDTATPGGQWHTRIEGAYPDEFVLAPSTK